MKIFITGGTGFIGKQVLNQLNNTQHQLVCLVRKTNPDKEKLQNAGIDVVEGDIRDKTSILQGMKGCDCLINMASIYSFWEPDNSVFKSVNVDGTRNVMESALETNISKVVHISTVGIFGKPSDVPIVEKSNPGPVRFSRYFQTKFEGERIAWELYKNNGLPLVVVYPCAVLGAGDPKASGAYVSRLINKRLPSTVFKNSILTWVHVNDVALGIIKATEKPNNIGERYIIGKHQLSLGDFNEMISDISGVSLPFMSMPDFLAMASAYMLTGLSNLIKKTPIWDMSLNQMKVMKEGFIADGSKAENELGITYTSIRTALEEQIAAING